MKGVVVMEAWRAHTRMGAPQRSEGRGQLPANAFVSLVIHVRRIDR
jgi:hypothetical protein